MTATTDKKLYAYIEMLSAAQKKSVMAFIKTILLGKEEEPYTIEQYNKELDDAEAEIERGECYTHEEVIEITKKMIDARKNNQLV